MNQFIRRDIIDMQPYTPIVPFEVLSQRLGRTADDIVKLDANENPYGPAPGALAALQAGRYFHIYPDPEANVLRDKLADFTGVPKERLLAGMGADELIDLVLRVVLEPGDAVIDCPPSFGMYPFSTAVNAGAYVAVARRDDYSLDVDAIEAEVARQSHAKVLFVCSPNNPDGSVVADADLRRLLELPLLVVLDEAYVDFSGNSRMAWALEYDNLVVLRTFSKLAGLAGLRVGYGIFPEWSIPHIMKIKQPYNVNVAASLAACGALDDKEWLREKVSAITAERDRMVRLLAPFRYLRPYPSRSNFVLFRVFGRNALELKRNLEQHGILVRHFAKPNIDNCIRISAGRPQDTNRLVEALREIG